MVYIIPVIGGLLCAFFTFCLFIATGVSGSIESPEWVAVIVCGTFVFITGIFCNWIVRYSNNRIKDNETFYNMTLPLSVALYFVLLGLFDRYRFSQSTPIGVVVLAQAMTGFTLTHLFYWSIVFLGFSSQWLE